MTKSEIKAAVKAAIYKVYPINELPAFIRELKAKTLAKLALGEITQETADAVLEAVKDFWGG